MNMFEYKPERIIIIIADILTRMVQANNGIMSQTSKFHAKSVPNIDIYNYLMRIQKYSPTSTDVWIALLVYFDRLAQNKIVINAFNIHRLIISTVMAGTKLLSDVFYTSKHYARVGGLNVHELNDLEKDFLVILGYKLHIDFAEMQHYASLLSNWMQPLPKITIPLYIPKSASLMSPPHTPQNCVPVKMFP